MTLRGPLKLIGDELASAHYETVCPPQAVGGVEFDFDAMFASPASLDLVVAIDLVAESSPRNIGRHVMALAAALDLVDSRRSLTVVLVGVYDPSTVRDLSRVARVLLIGADALGDQRRLRNSMSILLPLEFRERDNAATELWPAARLQFVAEHPQEYIAINRQLSKGPEAIQTAVHEVLAEPLLPPDSSSADRGLS